MILNKVAAARKNASALSSLVSEVGDREREREREGERERERESECKCDFYVFLPFLCTCRYIACPFRRYTATFLTMCCVFPDGSVKRFREISLE